VEAIFHEDALPEKWSQYAAINADFVRRLGTPPRASGARASADHPFVSSVPAQPVKRRT
jgi:hypothetical protein